LNKFVNVLANSAVDECVVTELTSRLPTVVMHLRIYSCCLPKSKAQESRSSNCPIASIRKPASLGEKVSRRVQSPFSQNHLLM